MNGKLIFSVSGGKDSSAMLCRAYELGWELDEVIFADTKLEFPEIYQYLHDLEKYTGYKITRLEPLRNWEDWFYGIPKKGAHAERGGIRGFPPELLPGCYIRRDSKILPLQRHIGNGNTVCLGFASDEVQRSRSKAYRCQSNDYRFPLIEWGWRERECKRYLERIGMPHPLADIFDRTGCWLCPKQSVKSLVSLYQYYPELWKKLKQYENDAPYSLKREISLEEVERIAEGKSKVMKLSDFTDYQR